MGAGGSKLLRSEFEKAIVDVLESDYDLDVRLPRDGVNRRRNGVATLRFEYPRKDSDDSSVVVRIEGSDASCTLDVDWSTPDTIEESAGECESLALAVGCYLEERREKLLCEPGERQRRWDD